MARRNQAPRDPEQEHRAEATRLRCVDRDTQRQIIAIHRNTAENRKLPKEDREFARQRADALERIFAPARRGGLDVRSKLWHEAFRARVPYENTDCNVVSDIPSLRQRLRDSEQPL